MSTADGWGNDEYSSLIYKSLKQQGTMGGTGDVEHDEPALGGDVEHDEPALGGDVERDASLLDQIANEAPGGGSILGGASVVVTSVQGDGHTRFSPEISQVDVDSSVSPSKDIEGVRSVSADLPRTLGANITVNAEIRPEEGSADLRSELTGVRLVSADVEQMASSNTRSSDRIPKGTSGADHIPRATSGLDVPRATSEVAGFLGAPLGSPPGGVAGATGIGPSSTSARSSVRASFIATGATSIRGSFVANPNRSENPSASIQVEGGVVPSRQGLDGVSGQTNGILPRGSFRGSIRGSIRGSFQGLPITPSIGTGDLSMDTWRANRKSAAILLEQDPIGNQALIEETISNPFMLQRVVDEDNADGPAVILPAKLNVTGPNVDGDMTLGEIAQATAAPGATAPPGKGNDGSSGIYSSGDDVKNGNGLVCGNDDSGDQTDSVNDAMTILGGILGDLNKNERGATGGAFGAAFGGKQQEASSSTSRGTLISPTTPKSRETMGVTFEEQEILGVKSPGLFPFFDEKSLDSQETASQKQAVPKITKTKVHGEGGDEAEGVGGMGKIHIHGSGHHGKAPIAKIGWNLRAQEPEYEPFQDEGINIARHVNRLLDTREQSYLDLMENSFECYGSGGSDRYSGGSHGGGGTTGVSIFGTIGPRGGPTNRGMPTSTAAVRRSRTMEDGISGMKVEGGEDEQHDAPAHDRRASSSTDSIGAAGIDSASYGDLLKREMRQELVIELEKKKAAEAGTAQNVVDELEQVDQIVSPLAVERLKYLQKRTLDINNRGEVDYIRHFGPGPVPGGIGGIGDLEAGMAGRKSLSPGFQGMLIRKSVGMSGTGFGGMEDSPVGRLSRKSMGGGGMGSPNTMDVHNSKIMSGIGMNANNTGVLMSRKSVGGAHLKKSIDGKNGRTGKVVALTSPWVDDLFAVQAGSMEYREKQILEDQTKRINYYLENGPGCKIRYENLHQTKETQVVPPPASTKIRRHHRKMAGGSSRRSKTHDEQRYRFNKAEWELDTFKKCKTAHKTIPVESILYDSKGNIHRDGDFSSRLDRHQNPGRDPAFIIREDNKKKAKKVVSEKLKKWRTEEEKYEFRMKKYAKCLEENTKWDEEEFLWEWKNRDKKYYEIDEETGELRMFDSQCGGPAHIDKTTGYMMDYKDIVNDIKRGYIKQKNEQKNKRLYNQNEVLRSSCYYQDANGSSSGDDAANNYTTFDTVFSSLSKPTIEISSHQSLPDVGGGNNDDIGNSGGTTNGGITPGNIEKTASASDNDEQNRASSIRQASNDKQPDPTRGDRVESEHEHDEHDQPQKHTFDDWPTTRSLHSKLPPSRERFHSDGTSDGNSLLSPSPLDDFKFSVSISPEVRARGVQGGAHTAARAMKRGATYHDAAYRNPFSLPGVNPRDNVLDVAVSDVVGKEEEGNSLDSTKILASLSKAEKMLLMSPRSIDKSVSVIDNEEYLTHPLYEKPPIFPEHHPATKQDVLALYAWVKAAIRHFYSNRSARDRSRVADRLAELMPYLTLSLHQLVQQLKTHCLERGLVLEKIWRTLIQLFDRVVHETQEDLYLYNKRNRRMETELYEITNFVESERGKYPILMANLKRALEGKLVSRVQKRQRDLIDLKEKNQILEIARDELQYELNILLPNFDKYCHLDFFESTSNNPIASPTASQQTVKQSGAGSEDGNSTRFTQNNFRSGTGRFTQNNLRGTGRRTKKSGFGGRGGLLSGGSFSPTTASGKEKSSFLVVTQPSMPALKNTGSMEDSNDNSQIQSREQPRQESQGGSPNTRRTVSIQDNTRKGRSTVVASSRGTVNIGNASGGVSGRQTLVGSRKTIIRDASIRDPVGKTETAKPAQPETRVEKFGKKGAPIEYSVGKDIQRILVNLPEESRATIGFHVTALLNTREDPIQKLKVEAAGQEEKIRELREEIYALKEGLFKKQKATVQMMSVNLNL